MGTKSGTWPPSLAPIVKKLQSRPLPPLVPHGVFDAPLTSAIEALTAGDIGIRDGESIACVRSALHLWNDDLDRSHTISQSIATPTGSYLHGVMHRREPDYGNSAYWFRRVGDHPVFAALLPAAREIAKAHTADPFAKRHFDASRWDPFAFVDACEEQGETEFLKAVQQRELSLLLDHIVESGRA